MTGNIENQRYHDLDALRAFAMLLGLLLHAAMSFVPLPVAVNATQDIYQDAPVYGWVMDAIHGFRMPLFFLVSGMFTAMIWRRRGLGGLIRHRLLRIGVPLMIGGITIVPVVFAVNILWSRNIWTASAKGDSSYVSSYINAGRNVNQPLEADMHPGNGGTPLHLAAATGQDAIANQLLLAGANVNARATTPVDGQASLATPLHWAASEADTEMVQLLIDHGAELNTTDAAGLTPSDYAAAKSQTSVTKLLSAEGGVPGSELSAHMAAGNGVQNGLPSDSAQETNGRDVDYLGDWIRGSALPVQLFALLCFFPAFVHLWFLWYLLWLVFLFVIVAYCVEQLNFRPVPTWMFKFPALWLWVLPPTLANQLLMVQSFGPDTATGLMPWPPTFVYYAIFFGFGALYYCRPQVDYQLGSRYFLYLALGLAILPVGIFAVNSRNVEFLTYHVLGSFISATYVWLMILGLFGAFRKICSTENKYVRYVSDAAYWIYLIHLPLVQILQIWLCDWEIASYLKIGIICGLTFGFTLITYELGVRYTWIGTVLHGKKTRQVKPLNRSSAQAELVGQ